MIGTSILKFVKTRNIIGMPYKCVCIPSVYFKNVILLRVYRSFHLILLLNLAAKLKLKYPIPPRSQLKDTKYDKCVTNFVNLQNPLMTFMSDLSSIILIPIFTATVFSTMWVILKFNRASSAAVGQVFIAFVISTTANLYILNSHWG